jgi:hypothetical protein
MSNPQPHALFVNITKTYPLFSQSSIFPSEFVTKIFHISIFYFNRHYNPGWVSAYSTVFEHSQQEVFTECPCQRHVKPPTWRRTSDLERSNFHHKRSPASEATLANSAAEGGNVGEKWPRILPKVTTSTSLLCSFTCRKARHGTDGFTSLPNEGVLRIFFRPKNPTASTGFEPANLGTKGQHATSRPPKPLSYIYHSVPFATCHAHFLDTRVHKYPTCLRHVNKIRCQLHRTCN